LTRFEPCIDFPSPQDHAGLSLIPLSRLTERSIV
jgi:hypothetical protein